MIELGKTNKLRVLATYGNTIVFDAEEYGEIEAENNDFILEYKTGDFVNVFLYPEGENINACIGEAYANLEEFAYLQVVANTKIGSFFDWGIDKDLFCPFMEQKNKLEENLYYVVYIYLDTETNRIAASTKIDNFISQEIPQLEVGQEINGLITKKSPAGYNVIVENKYLGLLYENEVFTELENGQRITAIVKKIREDNKIDLRLHKNDHTDISNFENQIVEYLKKRNGQMTITDDTKPEIIYKTFGISKKNFKKAIGALYRKKIINLDNGIVKLL